MISQYSGVKQNGGGKMPHIQMIIS